jgi:DNA-binding CsgD family transcriptional regulator
VNDQREPVSDPLRVSHRGWVWRVPRDGELTFGRGLDVDVRVAADPPDLFVSRRAGLIRCLSDSVLVINLSSRGLLQLTADGGVTRHIGPGEAITSEPYRLFEVIVVGEYGRAYVLGVDAQQLPTPGTGTADLTPVQLDGDATVLTAPYNLTPTQRRVLAALCAPMLDRGRSGGAATAREIGDALDLRPNYVRNVLKEIREQLTAGGVPGLVSEGPPQPGEDFRQPLALWAIRYGLGRTAPSPVKAVNGAQTPAPGRRPDRR